VTEETYDDINQTFMPTSLKYKMVIQYCHYQLVKYWACVHLYVNSQIDIMFDKNVSLRLERSIKHLLTYSLVHYSPRAGFINAII